MSVVEVRIKYKLKNDITNDEYYVSVQKDDNDDIKWVTVAEGDGTLIMDRMPLSELKKIVAQAEKEVVIG